MLSAVWTNNCFCLNPDWAQVKFQSLMAKSCWSKHHVSDQTQEITGFARQTRHFWKVNITFVGSNGTFLSAVRWHSMSRVLPSLWSTSMPILWCRWTNIVQRWIYVPCSKHGIWIVDSFNKKNPYPINFPKLEFLQWVYRTLFMGSLPSLSMGKQTMLWLWHTW